MRGSLLNVTVVGNKRDLAHEYRSVTTQEAMVIKHRVQNPRRVTKPKSIAVTHAQIRPRIILCRAIAQATP